MPTVGSWGGAVLTHPTGFLLRARFFFFLILYEKSLNLKAISQGDFGHFRKNKQIILSKVAKIALRDCF